MLGATFKLGRVRGVEIGANWTVVVIVGLVMWTLGEYVLPELAPGYGQGVYWMVGLLTAIGLLASIVAHELSHAEVANRHGVPVREITLWMFGGLARLSRQARDAGTELRIALAGPATSVVIGVVCLLAAGACAALGGPEVVTAATGWLGGLNVLLAAFNLLPGAPLDGGRVLTAILWRRSGDERAARMRAAHAGRITGQVLIALGIVEVAFGAGIGGVWLALVGWFLTTAAHGEATQVELVATLEDVRIADVMTTDVRTVDGRRTVADFVAHEAPTARVSSFPVVDVDGRLTGLITLRRLHQLPQTAWATTALERVAIPAAQLAVALPDELLLDVLARAGAADRRVLVMDAGRVVGIVTPADVTAAVERLSLTRSRRAPRAPVAA